MSNGYGFVQQQGQGPAQSTDTLGGNSIFKQAAPNMRGYVAGGAAAPNSVFQIGPEERKAKKVNRNSDTWAGRYAGLVSLVYDEEDVDDYSGSGVHGDRMGSFMSDNVKVPVARVTGGVIDKTTNKLNPYGKIVTGQMFVGPDQIPIPLDFTAMEQQVDRLNVGHTTPDQRIANALNSVHNAPTPQQLTQKRETLEQRAPEHRMDNMQLLTEDGQLPDFNTMVQQAGQLPQVPQQHQQQQVHQVQHAPVQQVPQVPIQQQQVLDKTASVFSANQPQAVPQQQPATYTPQPVIHPDVPQTQPNYSAIIAEVMSQMNPKTAEPAEEDKSMNAPVLNTSEVRVIMEGFFGKPDQKYKHYEKQDNMLILMYTIGDNIYEPPNSGNEFQMTIHKHNGTSEQYTAMFMGVAFKIEALGLGFQVFFVNN